jgi:hypothetical protein
MSEQNILNPTAASQLNPTYTIPHKDPQTIANWQPRSGKPYSRYMLARGMEFQLHWDLVQYSTYESLLQWFHQYEQDFFSYFSFQRNRYFTGQFLAEPQLEEKGNNQYNISATFVEIPELPMFQYPANWGVTSVFLEERNGFGDLVKLTGAWDRQDKNYLLWSEQFDNVAWSKETNVTVTANNQTDPLGGNTADTIATGATAGNGVFQQTALAARPGFQMTFSVWLKAAANTSASISVDRSGGFDLETLAITVTNAWQRFTFAHSATWTGITGATAIIRITNSASSIFAWGAQLEFGAAATTYAQTTAAVGTLLAPNASANLHGTGFAYWDAGTVTTDAAEWGYLGYGLRVWAYKGPDMGIMQVFLDGASLGTVDLYAAAATPSAAVFTQLNTPLGSHRVKLQPTNTKNAASVGFIVVADAIEVMR